MPKKLVDLQASNNVRVIRPHAGPQTDFLSTRADIAVYGGSAGGGKGAMRGAEIITPYGVRKWEDLHVGDRVCNHSGGTSEIIYITPWEERDMYKVSFADGTSTVVSDNHLWAYWETGRGKSKREKNAKYDDESMACHWYIATTTQLKERVERLAERVRFDAQGYRRNTYIKIPITQPVVFTKSYKTPQITIPPYVLGCLLGDGFLGNRENQSPMIGEKEVGDIQEMQSYFEEDGCGWFDYHGASGGFLITKGADRQYLVDELHRLNLYGLKSQDKFIPEPYMYLPIDQRFKLVQGLLDTDGYAGDLTKCSGEYCSTSKKLAEQVTWLLRSLGAYASISDKPSPYYRDENGEKVFCNDAWRVYFSAREQSKFFRLSRKLAFCRDYTRGDEHFGKNIVSIEPFGRHEMRCITVDNQYGLYLTNDFIVTHNSFALLIDPLRDVHVTGFTCLMLRKESTQLSSGGGLWDTACELYAPFHTETRQTPRMQHLFKSGAKIEFSHLQKETSTRSWDGAQLAEVCFDELQHFSERQFWYMLSRNRSTCGVPSRMRATCNPDPDSFLVKLLAWWIDEEGYPIIERSGKLRWFVRDDNKMIWYDSKKEGYLANKERIDKGELFLKSFTFIRATLDDNPTLLEIDPSYKANLSSLFEYERKRLLLGNWFARPMAGELFKTHYWQYVGFEALPKRFKRVVRYWDRAATRPSDVTPDPDYTVGALIGVGEDNRVYVLDVVRDRVEPYDVLCMIRNCARSDAGRFGDVEIWLEQDPGSAGKQEVATIIRELAGYDVNRNPKRANKLTYWKPFATQCKAGNVVLVKAAWNGMFVDELAGVTDGTQKGHDDMADASSGAFMVVASELHSVDEDTSAVLGNLRL